MARIKNVEELFKKGYNCAQSLLAVYGNDFGIDYETALKIASALGGGMGKTGDTCGAVTGALMIIGLKYGALDAEDKKSESITYSISRQFIKKFEARNSTVVCRDLLGFEIGSTNYQNNKYEKL